MIKYIINKLVEFVLDIDKGVHELQEDTYLIY
jgi:hypothetical protein